MIGPVSPAFLRCLAVLIALGHALLALTAKRDECFTADEIAHLAAGYAYNQRGDFRLQPENGNLPQRWAALPLTLARRSNAFPDTPAWRSGNVWEFGHDLFYRQGVSTDDLLFRGRAMMALFSAATALLVFAWSRALFGWRGAFLSLIVYALCPAFLAHGALATSDVVMTFFFLAATGAWWRMLERPGLRSASLSAAVFGFACVAKFSAVLLFPVFGVCTLAWWLIRPQPPVSSPHARAADRPRFRSMTWLVGSAALHIGGAWLVIWAFYGFRFSAFATTEAAQFYRGGWAWILDDIGPVRGLLERLRDLHALPEAFLYGFAFVLQFSRERAAFFSGEHGTTGWPLFFPFAFIVKSTLPFLLLVAVTAGGGLRRWFQRRSRPIDGAALRRLLPLAALFGVYWITSVTSHLNIGHRHILPIYPVLFIAIGCLGTWIDVRRPLALAFVALAVAWHAGESFRSRPHYLAYFNPFVGGSQNGWRHLVDSSLDWGQDLPGLKRWLDAHPSNEPVFLSYFGTGSPAYEGIRATPLPSIPEISPAPWRALSAGTYAVGATMLQQAYGPVRGPWTLELEREFAALRAREPVFLAFQNDPVRRAELLRQAPVESWTRSWKRYDQLRFARLCYYLRARPADGVVGFSIRIYRLSAVELHAAVEGTLAEWQQAIERAAAVGR